MKPISVRFQCFGPYMAEQFIDFTQLEANGLFLICGETGAGKTTILDAICYALYGKSSGALRGDFSVMRCKLAQKEETFTEFIFESGGKRYKFIRTLKYGRKNLNDTHNCLVQEGESWVPIFENPKAKVVNEKAKELIGLDYDQFRQVIILPQGQFEKLLVSNSEEKEKILVSLFHADRWQRIADEIYRRVAERDEQLKEQKKQITYQLREYHLEDPAQLSQMQEVRRTELEAMHQQEQTLRQALDARKKTYEQALLVGREFEALAKLEAEQETLRSRDGYFKKEAYLLSRADSAERIHRPYQQQKEATARRLRARELAENRRIAREKAEARLEQAQRRYAAHEEENPQQEDRMKQLTLLENAQPVYRTLEEKRREAQAAAKRLVGAENGKKQAERAFRQAETALQQAQQEQDRKNLAYQQANQAYLRGIGGILAENLAEGQPCPVCGSLTHPSPAPKADDAVTEQQLETLTQAMNAANDAVNSARSRRSRMESAFSEAKDACHQTQQSEMLARNDYENALAQTIPGIGSGHQLEGAIADVKARIAAFREKGAALAETLQQARTALAAAQSAEAAAEEEKCAAQANWTAAQAVWQEAMAQAGFSTEAEFLECDLLPEDKQRRSAALQRHLAETEQNQTRLEEKQMLLAGKEAPDLLTLRREVLEGERGLQTHTNRVALAENSLKKLEADTKNLQALSESYEADRTKTDLDLDFANRLRGRSGISLQRYVLGVMLTAITIQANRLLEGVYGGRYRLYRTDEVAGSARKSGLELEVLDSHTNARRSVTTLSGGEKFLVALSLAIGLSTVVQAQGSGIRLEAMFIDEGFGSLDREAVGDALEVLQGIGGKAGLVGIISHVEALAEVIPAKIEIRKGKNGSNCVIRA